MAKTKKEEESSSGEEESYKSKGKSKEVKEKKTKELSPLQERRLRIQQLKKKAKLKILKRIKKHNKKLGKSSELKPVRVDFMPFQLLQTGIIVYKKDQYTQLSMKPLYLGREYFAINTYPCPQSTCDFEVLLISGTVRMGIVSDNTLKKITMKHSISLCTMNRRLKIGDEYYKLNADIPMGSKIRLMVCVSTRKFRIYINQTKQKTCDFPPSLMRSPRIYFYVQLLQSACVKILSK